MTDALDIYTTALQSLTADRLDGLMLLVGEDMHFRDPFNDCRGRDHYRAILEDMFDKLGAIKFSVDASAWVAPRDAGGARMALIKWMLAAELQKKPWCVEGCSDIRFGPSGLVLAHYDYWDAASGLYERFPVIGGVLKLMRRRIRVD
jgi:steroid Delta-isomerase